MTEDEKWKLILSNSADADGQFYYAVKTTGIFCRPSCKAKEPARRNVMFFDSVEDAIAAGYRPCKRCRPDLLEYQPILWKPNSAAHVPSAAVTEPQTSDTVEWHRQLQNYIDKH